MKYYVIAGEASGDMHASNLVRALRARDPGGQFRGFGGDAMQQQGVELVRHFRSVAYMGFVEVLFHLRRILRNIRLCKEDIAQFQPDCVILVDYPGFNLRIVPYAHKLGCKVFYYISPQLWAWKSSRVHSIRKYTHKMFVILPFEKAFYAKHHVDVEFVGHPLLDAIPAPDARVPAKLPEDISDPVIAVLPGSRKQEIQKKLPVMLALARQFPDLCFLVACAPGMDPEFYRKFPEGHNIHYLYGQTYAILSSAVAALVTSGTATLETALFHVPEIVCYKGNPVSYQIARRLVKVPFISLVNLIMGKEVVPELIQRRFTEKKLRAAFERLLYNTDYRLAMQEEYAHLREMLGVPGAAERTAEMILQMLQGSDRLNTKAAGVTDAAS